MTKAKETVIDIADFDTIAASDRGAEFELKHPSLGKALGVFIKVLGSDSSEWREHTTANRNKRIQASFKAQRGIVKSVDTPTAEEIDADAVLLLTRCTVGWRTGDVPTMKYRGENLEFNAMNCQRVYTEQPWVEKQVDEFIGDISNFL